MPTYPLFYADPDHDNPWYMRDLCTRLPGLVASGYTTLFLEFLHEEPPTDPRELKDQFGDCSARRSPELANACFDLVLKARDLGMRVFGLTLKSYYIDMRQFGLGAASLAFRMLGGFDAVAAEIIRQRATAPDDFIVFLGSGHWPYLSERIRTLQLINSETELPGAGDPHGFSEPDRKKAESWVRGILSGMSKKFAIVEGTELIVKAYGRQVRISMSDICSKDNLQAIWEARFGFPADRDSIDAIHRSFGKAATTFTTPA